MPAYVKSLRMGVSPVGSTRLEYHLRLKGSLDHSKGVLHMCVLNWVTLVCI